MKHPQTWSISIACISSVMLAIGLAVVSTSKPTQGTSQTHTIQTQSIDALLNGTNKGFMQLTGGTQTNLVPSTIQQNNIQSLRGSLPGRPSSPLLTTRDQEIHPSIVTSSNSDKNIDINYLMKQVRVDMADLRMISPKGNNAWEKLQLILQQDAAHSAARDTLQLIMSSYIDMARQAGNEGDKKLQLHYLDQVHLVLYGGEYPHSAGTENFASLSVAGN